MKILAPAKINLGLRIKGKREDGYHEIETIFQTVSLYDELEIEKREDRQIMLFCDSEGIPADETNLVYKAAELLFRKCGPSSGVNIYLKKRIPSQAGLGGGSSDAASALLGINALLELGLSRGELTEEAKKLGADVPFFITGGTAYAEGIGDRIRPLPEAGFPAVLIVKPDIALSTAQMYSAWDGLGKHGKGDIAVIKKALEEKDSVTCAAALFNSFEEVAFSIQPVLENLKNMLTALKARGVLMSGSGSAFYALFDRKEAAVMAAALVENEFPSYLTFVAEPVSMADYGVDIQAEF